MIEIALFILAILFAVFVAWYIFQDVAFWRNDERLAKMQYDYFGLPLAVRLAIRAEHDAEFENAWFVGGSVVENAKERVRLATIKLIKSRISEK